jgi:hypothetical protein
LNISKKQFCTYLGRQKQQGGKLLLKLLEGGV